MDIRLPNGAVIQGVPEDTSAEEIRNKAIQAGIASESDFEDMSMFEKFVAGAVEGSTRVGQGLKQIGVSGAEALGFAPEGSAERYTQEIAREREQYLNSAVSQTGPAKVGEFLGEVVPTLAIPGGVVGGLARRIGTSALAGMASEAIKPTQDADVFSAERAQNALSGGVGAAFATGVLAGTPAAFSATRKFFGGPETQVKRIVSRSDLDQETMRVADEYGIFITPGEASGLQEVLKTEASLKMRSPEGATELGKAIRGRLGKIDAQTQLLVRNLIEEEPQVAMQLQQGYDILRNTRISDRGLNNLFSMRVDVNGTSKPLGPIGKRYYDQMLKNKDWQAQLDGVPKNSAYTLDIFKRYLDEQQQRLTSNNKGQAAKNVKDFKEAMLENMDQIIPSYAGTRQLAQLSITRKSMQDTLNKIPVKQVAIDPATNSRVEITDPVEFYKKTFKSDADFNEIKRKLSSSPNAVEKLTKLRKIFRAIEDSPLQKQITGIADEAPQPAGGGVGGIEAAVAFSGLDFFSKKRSEQIIKYITNENWSANLLEDLEPSMFRKASDVGYRRLTQVLSRVGGAEQSPEMQADIEVRYPQQ